MTLWEWVVVGMLIGFAYYKIRQHGRTIRLIHEQQMEMLDDLTRPPSKRGRA